MAHTCVTVWASVLRWVSRATSFEMSFSRTVLDNMGVSVLRPSPRVRGCCIHPLYGTVFVNDTAWTREAQSLDRTRMDGCSKSFNEMSDTQARSRWHNRMSYDDRRHMDHVDGDWDDKMRCDVVLRDLGLEQRQGRAEWLGLV